LDLGLRMNDNETQRIAAAINALRPDWPTQSLATLITSKLGTRTRRDVAVALTWVACDSTSKTPARVLEAGPWWLATNVEGGGRPVPWEERCGICSMPEVSCRRANAGEHEFVPNAARRYAVDDVRAWLPEVRQSLHEAKAGLCSHGVDPKLCKDRSHADPTPPDKHETTAHGTEETK
jgi:hypothetical protein